MNDDQEFVETQVTLTIKVPKQDWIDFLLRYNDIFSTNYIGYWGFGVSLDEDGWLIYEHGDERRPTEKECNRAVFLHANGERLPEKWHVLDEQTAIKAYAEACKMWGEEWMDGDHGDGPGYDIAIQMTLLGEIRYG